MAMLIAVRRRRGNKYAVMNPVLPAQRAGSPELEPAGATDLAGNLPGEASRQLASLHRQAAPVRTALARVLRAPSGERSLRLTADGETKVAAMLGQLDASWHVLHAVPVGAERAEIDHVVIGPGGVFTLSARNHPGGSVLVAGDLFMVDGRRYTYTDAARREAVAARLRLSAACGFYVHVTPVVVPVGADDFLVKREPLDVAVVTRARVNRWLTERAPVLTADEAARIYAAARRSDVWH